MQNIISIIDKKTQSPNTRGFIYHFKENKKKNFEGRGGSNGSTL